MLDYIKWKEKNLSDFRHEWEGFSLLVRQNTSLDEYLFSQYKIYQRIEGVSEVVGIHVFPAGQMPVQKKKVSKSSFFGPRQRVKKKEDINCIQTTMIYTLLTGGKK